MSAAPRASTEAPQRTEAEYCYRPLFVPNKRTKDRLECILLRVCDPKALASTELLEKIAWAADLWNRERKFPMEGNCRMVNGGLLRYLEQEAPHTAESRCLLYCDGLSDWGRARGVGYLNHYVAAFQGLGVFVAIDATFPIHKTAENDSRARLARALVFVADCEAGLRELLSEHLGGDFNEVRQVPTAHQFADLEKIELCVKNRVRTEVVERSQVEELGDEERTRFTMRSSDLLAVEETSAPSLNRERVLGIGNTDTSRFFRSVMQKGGGDRVIIEEVDAGNLLLQAELFPAAALSTIADLTHLRDAGHSQNTISDPDFPNAFRLIALQAHRRLVAEFKENFESVKHYANPQEATSDLSRAERSQAILIEHRVAAPESMHDLEELRRRIGTLSYRQGRFRRLAGVLFGLD